MSDPALYEQAARLKDTPPQSERDVPRCAACNDHLQQSEANDHRQVCVRCENHVLHLLEEVADLWCRLPEHILKPQGGGNSGAGGGHGPGGSAAPGNITVLSLLAGEASARLAVWDARWRDKLGWPDIPLRGRPDHALAQIRRFLRDHLPWAVRTAGDLVAGLREDLRRLVGYMRTATTDARSLVPLPQPCPFLPKDAPEGSPACGGRLLMDRTRREIRCVHCHAPVPMHEWKDLGVLVGAIKPDAA